MEKIEDELSVKKKKQKEERKWRERNDLIESSQFLIMTFVSRIRNSFENLS